MSNEHRPESLKSPTIAKRLGATVIGSLGAYVGVKLGEDILNFTLAFPVEMGVSIAVGSAFVNIMYAGQENNTDQQ